MTHAQIMAQARALSERSREQGCRLAVLSTSNLQFLHPHLIVASATIGTLLNPWIGPFNQIEQLIADDTGELWGSRPQVVLVFVRIEDIDPWLYDQTRGVDPADAVRRLESIVTRLVNVAREVRQRFDGLILLSNLTLFDHAKPDPFDASDTNGLNALVADANHSLARHLEGMPDAFVFDYARSVQLYGASAWRDNRLWHLARVPMSASAHAALAHDLAGMIASLVRPAAKCLVVDLDNTLWGGVLGDDGIDGIQLGDQHPGNAFKRFQSLLSGYRRRGFLLAISSKNDKQIVLDALDQHPEMLLRRDHFAAIEACWEAKPIQLRRIAEELNIGLEALVFIDDNPVERATVCHELPMVRVIDMPNDPSLYVETLRAEPSLDRPRLSIEDHRRANMYAEDADRRSFQSQRGSIENFLRELEMKAVVGECDPANIGRIHQLINKTNQFNLTTRRYSLEDVRRMSQSPDSVVAFLRVSDRFGDMGLVGVTILKQVNSQTWAIDTFLMSCRVMNRRIEQAMLAHAAQVVRARGATFLRGEYIPTAKNAGVAGFFAANGFVPLGPTDPASPCQYELALGADALPWPDIIQREASPRV